MKDVFKTTCYLFVMSTFITYSIAAAQDRLVLVQAVFRHGDRAPRGTFPNDKHRSYWTQGWGQLTQDGMRQEYNLGQLLKTTYGGGTFLSSHYNQSEIVITSSDFDRTLISAYCVLSGLYPPHGTDQHWNPDQDCQPVPVHTIPQNKDFMISMRYPCPRCDKLLSENSEISTLTRFMDQHKRLIDKIMKISGLTRDPWEIVIDSLYCQYLHNLTLPEWESVLPFHLVKSLIDVSATNFFPTSEIAKLKGGKYLITQTGHRTLSILTVYLSMSFIEKMIENIKAALNTVAHPKVYLYSGHDSTLVALLRVLDVFDNKQPRYSACVMMELWIEDTIGTPYIRILHRIETDSNTTFILQIPGCSEHCPFKDFVSILANHIPGNIKEECKIKSEAPTLGVVNG